MPNKYNIPPEIMQLWSDCNDDTQYKTDVYTYTTWANYYAHYYYLANPDNTNPQEAIEDTLHMLMQHGCSDERIRYILGLMQEDDIAKEELEDAVSIDQGYCIPSGLIATEKIIETH